MSLSDFQSIRINVSDKVASYREDLKMTVPRTVSKRITVGAMYFINTDAANLHYNDERTKSNLNAIVKALEKQNCNSLILNSNGSKRSCGRAVQYGKSSPSDIRAFVEEAFSRGVIESYARRKDFIRQDQKLITLPETNIQNIVQDWMKETGVGVDCSGFVLQAAIENRESERNNALALKELYELLGIQVSIWVPPELNKNERNANSFKGGPKLNLPTDLRPGVAWVVSNGKHIRIVVAVRTVTLENGTAKIEFDTEESAGDSTHSEPGPTLRTWRTHDLQKFDPINRVGGGGGNTNGSFHRIP